MTFRPKLAIAALMALGVTVSSLPAGIADSPIHGQAHTIDGDTLAIGERRIRLLGIDACELSQTAQTENGQTIECGQIAKRWLEQILQQTVTCHPTGTDYYGRTLAHCGTERIPDIAAQGIYEGIYFLYEYRNKPTRPDLIPLKNSAKQAGRGIWSWRVQSPRQARRTKR